jgi:hypothetical protein
VTPLGGRGHGLLSASNDDRRPGEGNGESLGDSTSLRCSKTLEITCLLSYLFQREIGSM